MLQPLRRKLRLRGLLAQIVRADAVELPFGSHFSLILLPFQGLSELVHRRDRQRALHEVARCLLPSGRFLCSLHNPAVRRRDLDGQWRTLGPYPDPRGDGTLRLTYRAEAEADGGLMIGTQRVEKRDRSGNMIEQRQAQIRFALPEREEYEAQSAAAGLRPIGLYGDYSGAEFHSKESAWMVWELEKPATAE
jgi:SAM-dependent methyltransferase